MNRTFLDPEIARLIDEEWDKGHAVVLDNMRKSGEWKAQVRCCVGLMGSWYQRSVATDYDPARALLAAIAKSDNKVYAGDSE